MTDSSNAPQINPGEITNWPMLKIIYQTDPKNIASLLPPGIEPGQNPNVNLTVYNFPVNGEPEYGIVTTVDADYNGTPGEYTLSYGIDQEAAIFISQNMNGQPKFPCDITYYRLGNQVVARCNHQGYTFVEFNGEVTGVEPNPDNHEQNEWWIKVSRAAGLMPSAEYDFPPHLVHVHSTYATAYLEKINGTLTLGHSPWDPIAELLPIREQISAHLWTPMFLGREISLAGKLDPVAFQPFVDVIGGSRWPGENGGPKKNGS